MSKNVATIAAKAVQELDSRLTEAKANHASAVTRCEELRSAAQRISNTMIAGTGSGSEDEVIESRQRLEAAAIIAEAKRRAVGQLEAEWNKAKAVHIAENIRAQLGGYLAWEQLHREVQAATVEFICRLDAIADKAEDRNAFLSQAAGQLRHYDGGQRLDGEEIAGVRRVLYGGEQTIQFDGERLLTMPPAAVFETAVDMLTMAALPTVREQRKQAAAGAE